MKSAFIAGITGQDGSYLAKHLLTLGYNVYGSTRGVRSSNTNNLKNLNILDKVNLTTLSLYDSKELSDLLLKIKPDEIYNFSAQSSVGRSFNYPDETHKSIVKTTKLFLETIKVLNLATRYYNACSSECFGDTGHKGANEHTPFNPKSPYGFAKAEAYKLVKEYRESYGIFAVSGILFNHESPIRPSIYVTQKIIDNAIKISKGSNKKLELGNLDIKRDWGWAPEYIEAIHKIVNHNNPEDFVIGTGHTYSLREFVKKIFEKLGLDWEEHVIVNKNFFRESEIMVSMASPQKAEEVLGWKAKYQMNDVIDFLLESRLE